MEDLKIGHMIADSDERQKDAIHMAIAPVVASERLFPGDHIGFRGDMVAVTPNPIGIVDPFLSGPVSAGAKFWMFLYPNTVTSLRHDWQHPGFPAQEQPKSSSGIKIHDDDDDDSCPC